MIRSLKQIEEDMNNGITYEDYLAMIDYDDEKPKKKDKKKKVNAHGVKNMYALKGVQKYMEKIRNPGFDDHQIDLNFNAILIGATGSGKTNALCAILEAFTKTFNEMYIFTQAKEPIYQFLESEIPSHALKTYYEGYRGVLKGFKDKDNFIGQSIVVFDDMVAEKDQSAIEQHFILGRKKSQTKGQGCSSFYLCQGYFQVPQLIRGQCSLIIIVKVTDNRQLSDILKRYSLGVTKEQLINMYTYCVGDGEFGNFFLIDTKQNDDNKKFRKCLTEYLNPDDFI